MREYPDVLKHRRILNLILKFNKIENVRLYIVGGFLRDIILGRERREPDIDFALKKNAIKFAAALAKVLSAGFVVLDKANGCARLVKEIQGRSYTLDFSDFRGRDLEQDLAGRDFSVNALAIELSIFLDGCKRLSRNSRASRRQIGLERFLAKAVIDPFHGLDDLRLGVIRALSPVTFDEDPLRILRVFSLSCILNFKIEPRTLRLAEKKRGRLRKVSFERIRDELFKILASPSCPEFLVRLDRCRILELIIPEIKAMRRMEQGPYHHLDVWQHTLETTRQLEKVIKYFSRNPDIRSYLDEEISSGRRRWELIRLGGLVHDIGKPKTLRIEEGKVMFHGHERSGADMFSGLGRRLKLSNDEIHCLRKMILLHLRPGYLAGNPLLTARAKFRFLRDAGQEAISILLISLADQRATRGDLTTAQSRRRHERVVRGLIKEYFAKKKEKKPERLLNGNQLIRHFKLKPSALIGKLLWEIEEARAIGRIKTKQDALKVAARIIKKEGRDEPGKN